MLQKAVSRGYRKPAVNIKVLELELFIDCFFLMQRKKYIVLKIQVCVCICEHIYALLRSFKLETI